MSFATEAAARAFCDAVWAAYYADTKAARAQAEGDGLDTGGQWVTLRYCEPIEYRDRWVVEVDDFVRSLQGRGVQLPAASALSTAPDAVTRAKRAVGADPATPRGRSVTVDVSTRVRADTLPEPARAQPQGLER